MADNPPEPPPKAKPPTPPGGLTGRLKVTANRLPSAQPGRTGKVVVMLSSVAKPTVSQQMLAPPKAIPTPTPAPQPKPVAPAPPLGQLAPATVSAPTAPPKIAPPLTPSIITTSPLRPPPLPGKKVMPIATPLPPEQRNPATTFVKLPKKTDTPSLPVFESKVAPRTDKADSGKVAPALLPPKRSDPVPEPAPPKVETKAPRSLAPSTSGAKGDMKRTGQIKLNIPTPAPVEEGNSLFVKEPAAREPKTGPLPAVIPPAPPLTVKPAPEPAAPAAKPEPASARTKTGPITALTPAAPTPPAAPPVVLPVAPKAAEQPAVAAKSEPVLNPAPVPLASNHPLHVAPPMTEKAHEEPAAKLPQPHLPETAPAPELHKAPRLIEPEPEKTPAKPPVLPPPLPPPKAKAGEAPSAKASESAKALPPVKLDATTKFFVPPATEGKPALRPAVLPSRALRAPVPEPPKPEPAPAPVAPVADKPAVAPTVPAADKPAVTAAKAAPTESAPPVSAPPAAKPEPMPGSEPATKPIEARSSQMEWKVAYVPPPAQTGRITLPPVEDLPTPGPTPGSKLGPIPAVIPPSGPVVEKLAAKPPAPVETKPEPAPKIEAKAEPKAEPKIEPVVPPAPKATPPALPPALPAVEKVAVKVPAPVETKPEPAPKIEAKAGPKVEPKVEAKAEPKVEPKLDPAMEAKVAQPVNQPLTAEESAAVTAKSASVTGLASVAATVAATSAVASAAAAAVEIKRDKKPPLPPTRVERARGRRQRGVIVFWLLVPFVAALLYFGILYYGRDTRAEGQVIPPQGMSLADEVWIVSDFSSLASGVADDDAKERVPLQLAIQEAQDHVQRVQADIASREERIRLIQEDIQSAKDEVTGLIKKSQGDAQSIYDNEGKELDGEYNDKMAALGHAISDRAASLKLTYQPDPAFPSPEVWANAYRLALYQTPAGVDGTKEHQWIADQMKAWRDFQKSMDDRYEQMREEAAATKQGIGPNIADLNNKMADLNSRIAGTQGEEEPLKVELKQAMADLAEAQGAQSGLDDKYYSELNSLPGENISYHIPVRPDGRFTWIPDSPFGEGELEHDYTIFSRAIRADGREYWSLHEFRIRKNETTEVVLEPGGFESTKQILRPSLSPDEIEQ